MDFDFGGQVVLVTGGASGIGRGIAEAFGARGARVALTYLSSTQGAEETVATINDAGGSAYAIHADLTREDQVEHVVSDVIQKYGRIDVLVANTGGLIQRSPVADCSLELWNQALALNLTSTFLCCRAVLPRMIEAKQGAIVTISSLAAHDGGGQGAAHYAATKGAVITFTKALAKEVGPQGIRVNGIAPGLIGTQFHDRFSTADMRSGAVSRTPLRREGTPADVAGAALFLASPFADFLAGETIEVNGGQGVY